MADEQMAEVEEISPARVIGALQTFTQGFKYIRDQIEAMDDDQLLELFEQAKQVGQVSWLIRCMAIGIAKSRAIRGDGMVKSIASTFGIGVRAAELDILVYETFIRDNPDFEPALPLAFYQLAASADNPTDAIEKAIQLRAENPKYPINAFRREMQNKPELLPIQRGAYIMVRMEELTLEQILEEARANGEGITEMGGHLKLYSVGGSIYGDVQ